MWLIILFLVLIGMSILEFIWNQKVESFEVNHDYSKPRENIPQIQVEHYEASLFMVGDALYHDGVYKDGLQSNGTYSFDKNLELLKPFIQKYDLAYYNQESMLGGKGIGLSTYPRFNSPEEVGDAFIRAGFNLVSTANNHSMDRGEEAILNSFNYWKNQKEVLMSGTCDSYICMEKIPVGEVNGITYAFLSYTTSLNGLRVPQNKWYLVNEYSDERVKKDIEAIKEDVDVILVAMHWGAEYQDYPNQEQKHIANYLADLGVHVVIGSHPHVIEPIEKIKDTYVFYSLGNFISAQNGIDKLVGLGAGLTIKKDVVNGESSISISNLEASLTYTYYNKKYRDFKVYPFSKLDSSILNNFKDIAAKKKKLVTSYGVDVHWLS